MTHRLPPFPVHATHRLFQPGDPEMERWTADYVETGVPICKACGKGGWQLIAPCEGGKL